MFEIAVNISYIIFSYAYGLPSYHISHTVSIGLSVFFVKLQALEHFCIPPSFSFTFYILQNIILIKFV
jgi:hypothetical protein